MALEYDTSIIIDLPRERVIELFDDPANMPRWQKGFVSFEPIEGIPGQPGAKSRLSYRNGKRDVVMIETVTRRDLPDAFDGTYDVPGAHNIVQNRFTDLGNGTTRWDSHNVFEFSNPLFKAMAWLLPGMFRKQTLKFADDFKAFAERGVDIRNA